MTTIEVQIYSPRWGHEDTYEFEFTEGSLTISMGPRKSRCIWRDGMDPEWQGESIEDILRNDSIYPPAILPDLFEHVWKSWRDGTLDDAEARTELESVAAWLNAITAAKPSTDFWQKYF